MLQRIKSLIRRIRYLKNWYFFVFPLNRLSDDRIAHLRNGLKIPLINFRYSEYALMEEVMFLDAYGIKKFPNPKVIVDLGANIGTFSLMASKIWPEAKIWAYEPDPIYFARLKENIQLNGARNISPFPYGVSKQRHITFHNPRRQEWKPPYPKGEDVSIECVPLSEIPDCDVLKCDIDGEEENLFENPSRFPYVVFELHKENSSILQKFKGYEVRRSDVTSALFTFIRK